MSDYDIIRFRWTNGAFDARLVSTGRPARAWAAFLFRAGDDVDPVAAGYTYDSERWLGATETLDDLVSYTLHHCDSAEIDAAQKALTDWKAGRVGWTEVAP